VVGCAPPWQLTVQFTPVLQVTVQPFIGQLMVQSPLQVTSHEVVSLHLTLLLLPTVTMQLDECEQSTLQLSPQPALQLWVPGQLTLQLLSQVLMQLAVLPLHEMLHDAPVQLNRHDCPTGHEQFWPTHWVVVVMEQPESRKTTRDKA
jgi:hypothetical protein